MRAEERCGDAVAGNARAGKRAVIDLPVAARGAALLEQGSRAAEALRKGERLLRAAHIGVRNVPAASRGVGSPPSCSGQTGTSVCRAISARRTSSESPLDAPSYRQATPSRHALTSSFIVHRAFRGST